MKLWKIKFRYILVMVVVIIFVVLAISRLMSAKAAKNEQSSVILLNRSDVVIAKSGVIDSVVNFTGDLSPVKQTIISAEVDARINKVWVDEGQLVKAGQALADLDTLDLAQAVSQQEAAVASAQAQLLLSQQKKDKEKELLDQGFISKIAYDELVTDYKAKLQNYKAQAALLTRTKKQLADTHITAPFDGIIYQKAVQPGQLALKNTKLFALANLSQLEIKAAIPSDKINSIKVGLPVVFRAETDSVAHNGTISRINQVAELGTRSYMVYISFANTGAELKAGQFVKGQIILASLKDQLQITCDAIRDNNGDYVLSLIDGKVVSRPIKIVLQNSASGQCAVSGVNSGEQVLAGNVMTVKAGDSAKIVD